MKNTKKNTVANDMKTFLPHERLSIQLWFDLLEPVCCKKWQKSPNQETGLENKGPLNVT